MFDSAKMKKNDSLLIGVIVLVAACLWIGNLLLTDKGEYVTVYQDGVCLYQLDLHEDIELLIEGEWGRNVLSIQNDSAKMIEADCPDKLCIKQVSISKNGEVICCLPHKLIITVVSKEDKELDSFTG